MDYKKIYSVVILSVSIMLLGLSSCVKSKFEPKEPNLVNIGDVVFPEGFDFKTSDEVEVNFVASSDSAIFIIYATFEDQEEKLISKGNCFNGQYQTTITVPSDCGNLKAVEISGLRVSSVFIPVSSQVSTNFKRVRKNNKANCGEILYAMNNQGDFYAIDNEDGLYTETKLSDVEGRGSISCAADESSRFIYYNTGTTLRYYDIDAGTFHIAQEGNPFNGSYKRMEYNSADGLLYIGKNEIMYTLNPSNNNVINQYDIVGLESSVSGGDIAISSDGTIYMCSFSGVYRVELNGNIANAIKISPDKFKKKPTGIVIDKNDRLYVSTDNVKSELIEMDKSSGAWSIVKIFDFKIGDLTSLTCNVNQVQQVDTDNDGIVDELDDYPEDASRAFNNYTPSEFGYGSLGFEDQWPVIGDFDLNDMVIDYNFTKVANKDNEIVEIKAKIILKAVGASFHNGFGFEMPFNPNIISSVIGSELEEGIISLNANGTEAGQTNAVVIVFDDTYNHILPVEGAFVNTEDEDSFVTPDTFNITISFINPVSDVGIGNAPFNPFIIINRERGRELHLPDHEPTDLMTTSLFGTSDDASSPSSGTYYKTKRGAPFAIGNIDQFDYPKEKQAINLAYYHFVRWSLSLGSSYQDWHRDNTGYRNAAKIYSKRR